MSLQLRFSVKILVALFTVCVFSSVIPVQTVAQTAPVLAVIKGWEVDSKLAERQAPIISAFKAGNVEADRAGVDAFFDKYYFARWTLPENLGQVQGFAKDFLGDLAASTGNGREYLLTKSFGTLQKIIADASVTPVSRYNAILVIGQLTQKEPTGRGLPPTPYVPSLPYLIAEYKKKDNPQYIRLGALIGIVRHVSIGIADENLKNSAAAIFINTIQSGKPKEEINKEDQEEIDWLRLLALDGLNVLKSTGADGSVVNALIEVMENPQEDIEVRTKAARVLGDLNFDEAGTSVNFQTLGKLLIALMKDTGDKQCLMVTGLRDKARVARGGVPGLQDGGLPVSSAAELEPDFAALTVTQQQEITEAVQSIKANVLNVLYGMRGSRFVGTANAGIFPKLPADDPVAVKINAVHNKAVKALFQILDDGLPEDKTKKAAATAMSSSYSDMDSGVRAKPKDEKQLKVNFTIIEDALKRFSAEINNIISGG